MVALAVGKTYLTVGGYVVEIINDRLQSSERTSPGRLSTTNRTCLEINKNAIYKDGWYYNTNGIVTNLNDEWTEKLKIVEEFPYSLPKLSEEYEWADGFPQYREPKNGEYYVTNHFTSCYEQYDKKDKKPIIYSTDNLTPNPNKKMELL